MALCIRYYACWLLDFLRIFWGFYLAAVKKKKKKDGDWDGIFNSSKAYKFRSSKLILCHFIIGFESSVLMKHTALWLTGDDPREDGKILFKKPAKRSSADKFQGITASSSKKKRDAVEKEEKVVNSGKKVKNSSLLSFGDDEEEEED